jgi:membrane dipeptidase
MTDDMLRALAKNGGVAHINFFEGFLDHGFMEQFGALKEEQAQQDASEERAPKFGDRSQLGPAVRRINARRIAKVGRIPLSRLLDHIDHAVSVAGIDHVGLGSDFDGADDQFPEGMEDISKIPNLVQGLMERGYSDESILKILGGNTLRVMRQVERVSQYPAALPGRRPSAAPSSQP